MLREQLQLQQELAAEKKSWKLLKQEAENLKRQFIGINQVLMLPRIPSIVGQAVCFIVGDEYAHTETDIFSNRCKGIPRQYKHIDDVQLVATASDRAERVDRISEVLGWNMDAATDTAVLDKLIQQGRCAVQYGDKKAWAERVEGVRRHLAMAPELREGLDQKVLDIVDNFDQLLELV